MEKMEPVIRSKADESSIICPVRSWGAIIDRIKGYKGLTLTLTVNTVKINRKLKILTRQPSETESELL